MADTRIFKITRQWPENPRGRVPRRYNGWVSPGRIEYGDKRVASAKCGAGGFSHKYGPVVKVEATNAEATSGWEDVTAEFLSS